MLDFISFFFHSNNYGKSKRLSLRFSLNVAVEVFYVQRGFPYAEYDECNLYSNLVIFLNPIVGKVTYF